ncbi:Uncharacterized protein TPAR_00248 [Tolypocladium paradoxum]|uniref:LysM domain-containing protein n=1 Tax=Tolypocladium paradoxum TaxID=94208 RepID=A0A2S4LAU4_9HYPO|nr:Uncharacterized protein TPAR_00248 [Tolypocladium paradoxum]
MHTSVASVAAVAFMAASVLAGRQPAYSHDSKIPTHCNLWYDNDGGYPCLAVPFLAEITREQFLAWNPSLDKDSCTPFDAKQSYCVGVCEKNCTASTTSSTSATTSSTLSDATSAATTTSTSTSGPPVATPTPVQDGMVKGCKTFKLVTEGLTCRDIAYQYGLLESQLVSFNPAFKEDCSNLVPGYYACVALGAPTQT